MRNYDEFVAKRCEEILLKDEKYQRLWVDYAQKYNRLSDKIAEVGIDIQLQIDLVDALKRLILYRTLYRTENICVPN